MKSTALCFVVSLGVLNACSNQTAATTQAAAQSSAAPASTSAAPPGAAASPAAGQIVTGTVVETMNAASYTYVRVKTESNELWAASAQFPVSVGDRVVVSLEMPMENFHSQTLNRDFPVIYFVPRIAREGEPQAPPMMPGHAAMAGAPAGTAAPAAPAVGAIAPAAGGITVADVWAKRAALSGKSVTVRGQVVKFNGGILGRNWLHVQDGSGKAADGTHDLTITTDAVAKVGDVVTVTGTVAVGKDFGAGYAYAVIVESATITQK